MPVILKGPHRNTSQRKPQWITQRPSTPIMPDIGWWMCDQQGVFRDMLRPEVADPTLTAITGTKEGLECSGTGAAVDGMGQNEWEFDVTGNSWSFRIRPDVTTTGVKSIIRKGGGAPKGFIIYVGGTQIKLLESSTTHTSNDITIGKDCIAHVVMRADKTGVDFYIDGVNQTNTTTTTVFAINTAVDLLIGDDFNGLIDDVRWYSWELSADEISQDYQHRYDVLRPANDAPFLFPVAGGPAVITGTGALSELSGSITGIATRSITGSGTLSELVGTITGIATRSITGSGTLSELVGTITGSGAVGNTVTGSGALIETVGTISGTGVRSVTGSGVVSEGVGTINGTGVRNITGSGALAEDVGSITGSGLRTITGSGAIIEPVGTITGRQVPSNIGGGGARGMIKNIGKGMN